MNESELIEGCIKENKVCQKALYDRFSGKMYSLCLRYAENREDAEDIMHDGFIKVLNNIQQFKASGSLEGWVRKIMVNTAIQHLVSEKRSAIGMSSAFRDDVDFEDSNEWNVISTMSASEIMKLISELPVGYRTVINLFAIDGYSHDEIAQMLKINESTSRSQLSKARKMLKERIERSTAIYHHGS